MHGTLADWLDAPASTDEEFLDRVWRLALRRPPDADARERALAQLRDGTLSRSLLLRDVVGGGGVEQIAALDAGLAFAAAERARRGRPRELRAPATSDERPIEILWALARY